MNINFDFNFWTLLFCLLNFCLALFSLIAGRNKAQSDELKAMKSELIAKNQQHGERLARIEADIENSINVDDVKAVHRRLDEILADSKTVEGKVEMLVKGMEEIRSFILRGNDDRR